MDTVMTYSFDVLIAMVRVIMINTMATIVPLLFVFTFCVFLVSFLNKI